MNTVAREAPADPVLQYVTFRLGAETFGINVMQVQEVLRPPEIATVPGAPRHVLGIINLRGSVVTVLDTHQCFGLAAAEVTDNSRIIIMEVEHHVLGIMVESVTEVVYLRQGEIELPPNVGSGETSRYIQGVTNRDGELLILVDLEKLLAKEARQENVGQ